jgi:hypothetical protein
VIAVLVALAAIVSGIATGVSLHHQQLCDQSGYCLGLYSSGFVTGVVVGIIAGGLFTAAVVAAIGYMLEMQARSFRQLREMNESQR